MRYLLLLLIFVADASFAEVFTPSSDSISLEVLSKIFGSVMGSIYLGGTAPNVVLTQMIEKFNFIIVSVGTVIISYTGLISMINTAQEGTTMGKKYSSVWVPMRSLIGMLLMVPSPASGYSMIQVTVMWIIINGIGAADSIWNVVMDNLAAGIGAASDVKISDGNEKKLKQSLKTAVESAMDMATCAESLRYMANNSGVAVDNSLQSSVITNFGGLMNPYSKSEGTSPELANIDDTTSSVSYLGKIYTGVKDDQYYYNLCGGFDIDSTVTQADAEDSDIKDAGGTAYATKAEEIYNYKILATLTMINTLRPLARKIVEGANWKSDSNYYDDARKSYIAIMSSAYKSGAGDYDGQKDEIEKAVNQGKKYGWLSAGSFYFVLNQSIQQKLWFTAKQGPIENEIPLCRQASCDTNASAADLKHLDNFLDNNEERNLIAKNLYQANLALENLANQDGSRHHLNMGAAKDQNDLLAPMMEASYSALEDMAEMLTADGDPLLGHAQFGSSLMLTAEILYLSIVFALTLLSIPSGMCSCIQSGYLFFLTTFASFIGLIIAVCGIMWSLGASMAIYVPLIPYMKFTVSALGWLILVIEAIIAAPVVALGIIAPSGDELGKVGPSLMLLAGIFLRPSLMIFGFILAARLYRAIVYLVDFGMATNFKTIAITGSLFYPLAVMALYAAFVMSLANKCFSLIYILPDKILRWIGGAVEQTDDSAMQETKGSFEKGSKEIGDAGKGAAAGGLKNLQDNKKEVGEAIDAAKAKAKAKADKGAGKGDGAS